MSLDILLQEGLDTSLNWLFYVLLGFMALVIVVGSIVGGRSGGEDQNSNDRPVKPGMRAKPVSTSRPPGRPGRTRQARKSK